MNFSISNASSAPRERFEALDSLRGILALLVAMTHLSVLGHFFYWPVIRNAGLCVDFFFVLSGFVICHAYGDRLRCRSEIMVYSIRRFGRIYPLHFFTLFIFVVLECIKYAATLAFSIRSGEAPFSTTNTLAALIDNLLLLQGMGVNPLYTWNGPSWSISSEFWTYLVFAFVILLLGAPRRGAFILAAALSVWAFARVELFTSSHLASNFWRCLYGFFIGAAAYSTYCSMRSTGLRPCSWIEAAAIALVAMIFHVKSSDSVWHEIFFSIISPPLFSLVIVCFAFERGIFSKLLLHRSMAYLGRLSLSIYMTHFVVGTLINAGTRAFDKVSGNSTRTEFVLNGRNWDVLSVGNLWAMDMVAIFYLIAVIALSAFTYRYVEVPGQSWANRLAINLKSP